jgi:hypothetical protein
VGKPRGARILATREGSSIVAMIFFGAPTVGAMFDVDIEYPFE